VKLILQPDDGVGALLEGIENARESIAIAVFRFDRSDIQHALENAAARGVRVHALIANTNRGGESNLRQLEMDLLRAGIEVSRTAEDLLRYHYKFMIVDRQVLYLLTFNYTHLDIGRTRSFGIVTRNHELVREARRLFEADVRREAYVPGLENLIVSPVNARRELSRFIQGSDQELLIYDPEISDPAMIRLLRDRAKAGVDIRIIGRISKHSGKLGPHGLMRMRFHTRTILRDRRQAFVGSQSLREAELDRRRELGMVLHNRDVVNAMLKAFEDDWATLVSPANDTQQETLATTRAIKRTAKTLVKDLPPEPLVEQALKHAIRDMPGTQLTGRKFEHQLEDAVRQAVEDAVSQTVREAVEGEART
jgi:phosphatidylserine/phosphatidylglycerophosphate/cardiolipin synthase-like enzyme